MEERHKQGLCYNCNEPYVHGKKCSRLFYLEASDYIMEEPKDPANDGADTALATPIDTNTPMISLVAIVGIYTEDMMQLHITMGNEQFVALLDSGSTKNFIRGDIAYRVGL